MTDRLRRRCYFTLVRRQSRARDRQVDPRLYEHKLCGKMFDPVMTCSECGEPLSAKEVHVHVGPGANEGQHLPAGPSALARAADGARQPKGIS